MRRFRTLLTCCALLTLGAPAARAEFTAEEALLSMPARLLAPAMPQTIADLVDYAKAGRMAHAEKNRLGGPVKIHELSAARAALQTGEGRMLTLQLLPAAGGDTVVALIETLDIPQPDGRLTVYSRSWEPMPKMWREPQAADWLTAEGRKNRQTFADSVPFIVADYAFDSPSGILTLTNRSERRTMMLPALRYSWTPKGFRKLKD